jgi:hypothetical protein
MDDDDEEPPEERAIGPKCEVCGQSTDSLYPVLVKRERRGVKEMVQIYLCAYHLLEREEDDASVEPLEEEEKKKDDFWDRNDEDDEDDEEDEDWDRFCRMCCIDRVGQSWG